MYKVRDREGGGREWEIEWVWVYAMKKPSLSKSSSDKLNEPNLQVAVFLRLEKVPLWITKWEMQILSNFRQPDDTFIQPIKINQFFSNIE